MRDEPCNNGRCPVADDGPQLIPINESAVLIYKQAEGAAVQVQGEKKNTFHVRAADVEALMRIHDVPEEDRSTILARVFTLQDIGNELRLNRPKKKASRKRR